ncbi:MAG: dipeptidase PepV [Acidaminococcaceae bacterium]|nr:dipeptidase PepV [Acidaminococcaceae bacterium]MDD4722032.1 dipeptidase PepV [Acidaminococcaceae bacterium]
MKKILNELVDKSFAALVKDAQEIMSIESVLDESTMGTGAPFGSGIAKALETMLSKAADMGLLTKNLEGYAGYAQLGKIGEQVAVLAHLDVVPADGDGWLFPPYAAQIADGKLYGRGSMDDKGPALACLYALKAIKDSGLPINRHARLILGTDEESFSRGIKYYLQKEEPPACGFSPDAEFPIIHAEKGILHFSYRLKLTKPVPHIIFLKAGDRINVVPDLAEALVTGIAQETVTAQIKALGLEQHFTVASGGETLKITSLGVTGHASMPENGYNAIQNMLQLMAVLLPGEDCGSKIIKYLARNLKMETNGVSLGIGCQDEISGALTLNTATMQLDDREIMLQFDIRYPVTYEGERLLSKLKDLAEKLGVEFTIIQHAAPLYVEKDCPFIKVLQETYKDCTGAEPEIFAIGGGTYCRSVENTVSFGPVFPGQPELAHQCNEYIALEDLRKITKIYAQAIYNLLY